MKPEKQNIRTFSRFTKLLHQVCDGVGDVNGGLFAGHPLQLRARHGSVGVTQQHLEALHHGLGDGGTQIASLERQNNLNNKIIIQI